MAPLKSNFYRIFNKEKHIFRKDKGSKSLGEPIWKKANK